MPEEAETTDQESGRVRSVAPAQSFTATPSALDLLLNNYPDD